MFNTPRGEIDPDDPMSIKPQDFRGTLGPLLLYITSYLVSTSTDDF